MSLHISSFSYDAEWRLSDDLEKLCDECRNPIRPRHPRPYYTIDYIRDAANRYERSLTHELKFHQVAIPVLFHNAQLEINQISTVLGIKFPHAYLDRFKPYLRDPNYYGRVKFKEGKHPELLGLTISEAAKVLGCSRDHLQNAANRFKTASPTLQILLDKIFLFDNPPIRLRKAANEKRMKENEIRYNKRRKHLIGD